MSGLSEEDLRSVTPSDIESDIESDSDDDHTPLKLQILPESRDFDSSEDDEEDDESELSEGDESELSEGDESESDPVSEKKEEEVKILNYKPEDLPDELLEEELDLEYDINEVLMEEVSEIGVICGLDSVKPSVTAGLMRYIIELYIRSSKDLSFRDEIILQNPFYGEYAYEFEEKHPTSISGIIGSSNDEESDRDDTKEDNYISDKAMERKQKEFLRETKSNKSREVDDMKSRRTEEGKGGKEGKEVEKDVSETVRPYIDLWVDFIPEIVEKKDNKKIKRYMRPNEFDKIQFDLDDYFKWEKAIETKIWKFEHTEYNFIISHDSNNKPLPLIRICATFWKVDVTGKNKKSSLILPAEVSELYYNEITKYLRSNPFEFRNSKGKKGYLCLKLSRNVI